MKRTRTVAALAAVALIVALTATAHASGSGDAQGPKPFASCADIAWHAFNVTGSYSEVQKTNGPTDPLDQLDGEPGEVHKTTYYATQVRVDIVLANNVVVKDACWGGDGHWGTSDDRVSFHTNLLHPEQDEDGNWSSVTEITDATLVVSTEDAPNPSYAFDARTDENGNQLDVVSISYDLSEPYFWYSIETTADPTEASGFTETTDNGKPDVCAEARSIIDLDPDGIVSDVSPDLNADGSRVLVSDPEDQDPPATILQFCEDSSAASAKAG